MPYRQLTSAEKAEILRLYKTGNWTMPALGIKYGVTKVAIHYVIRGRKPISQGKLPRIYNIAVNKQLQLGGLTLLTFKERIALLTAWSHAITTRHQTLADALTKVIEDPQYPR